MEKHSQLTNKEQPDNLVVSVEELNHGHRVFDFLRFGFVAFTISMILVVISIVAIFAKGFTLGQDFTGGTTVEITLSQNVELDDVRNLLKQQGYHDPVVQYYGSSRDIIIRLPLKETIVETIDEESGEITQSSTFAVDNTLGSKISDLMHQHIDSDAQIKRVEFVGPTVGAELAQDGILAILASLISILIYIGFRFEWRFGTGAVVGLAHDAIITAGYLVIFERELDLTIIAAMLSIIGYSLNDTIVVFDRIRENFRKIRRASPYDIVNISLTQTLRRTIMTSATTLAVVIVLYFFGGSMLKGFSETLAIGIVLGTLSSIYVASYMAYKMGIKREHFIQQKVEVEGADQAPIMR